MTRTMSIICIVAVPLLTGAGSLRAQDSAPLTPKSLQAALDAKPSGAEADRLAERIRTYFGGTEALANGGAAKIDDLLVAFALESPPPAGPNPTAPRVSSDAVLFTMPLTRVGTTNVYAGVAELANGTAFSWHYEVGARRFGGGQLEAYETHPDSREQAGVPKGTVKQMPPWESTIFPGHEAGLVGLRAGAVPARQPGRRHGLPGRRRPEGLRADGVRQPDRRRRTCR